MVYKQEIPFIIGKCLHLLPTGNLWAVPIVPTTGRLNGNRFSFKTLGEALMAFAIFFAGGGISTKKDQLPQ